MKAILTVLFIVVISSSFAVTHHSCMYLAIEPSSLNRALGDITGVVNI